MAYALSVPQVRVLGALIEKANTTPDYYPLTLNGLLNACNQKSSREPVLTLSETEILRAIDVLRDQHLAWMVQSVDARVPKYEHNFDRHLGLTLQETAVLCVLMLRGPQTVGELRGRTGRIYPFESLDEVSVAVQALIDREEPLMVKLPMQPGRKEARYCHLLAGEPDPELFEAAPMHAGGDRMTDAALEEENRMLAEDVARLSSELDALRDEVHALQEAFAGFKAQFE